MYKTHLPIEVELTHSAQQGKHDPQHVENHYLYQQYTATP